MQPGKQMNLEETGGIENKTLNHLSKWYSNISISFHEKVQSQISEDLFPQAPE